MWMLRLPNDNLAVLAGAAIFFTLLAQHVSANRDELGSAMLCWLVLPHLFKLSKSSDTPHIVSWGKPEGQGTSSRSLWIFAVAFASFVVLQTGTGLVHAYPLLTTCLLAFQRYLLHESDESTDHPWYFSRHGSVLIACFITLTLSHGSIRAIALSAATVAPLFVVYTALLPKPISLARYLPHIEDFEDDVQRLSRRVSVILVLVLGRKTMLYGTMLDALVPTICLGLSQAFSWYFVARMSRLTTWCIAPTIATFGLVAVSTPSPTPTQALVYILASAFALAQIQSILPRSSTGSNWLWVVLLLPLVAYVSSARESSHAQSWTQSSFIHDVHHPIEMLMDNAKASFEDMLNRQSQTYAAAHAEYQRRYGIEPPPGFEAWYEFAVANQSPLIDDFDTIYTSVSPFWKMSSTLIQGSIDGVHAIAGSETWRCRFHSEDAKTTCSHPSRVNDRHIQTLFNKLSLVPNMSVPDVEFLVNHLDEPRVLFPVEHRSGVWTTHLSHQKTWSTLTHNCPTGKSIRQLAQPVETFGLPFITNSTSNKDLCQHLEYKTMHGTLVSPTSFSLVEGWAPVLSTGTLSTMGDILFPSPAYTEQEFIYDDSKVTEWDDKRNELYWAGSNTGGFSKTDEWHQFHRQRFVSMAQNLEPRPYSYLQESRGVVSRTTSKVFNKQLFNAIMTRINQCSPLACIAQFAFFKPAFRDEAHRATQSRFVFDTDGNGISGRYYRLLASKSLPLKQTLLREWHDDRVMPWVHYIPVSLGMEELPEMMNWLAWNERGQKKAREAAEMGRDWFGKALREVDMTIYNYRLLLELARLQDPKREARPE